MFTGIVEEIGTVKAREPSRLIMGARVTLEGAQVGDSIAVNGACLTMTRVTDTFFSVDVTPETLRRTNLGLLKVDDPANLERALALGDRLGGHFVQGHVDGTGTVESVEAEGDSVLMKFTAPPSIMKYVVEKGFMAVDGVSLTVVRRDTSSFLVSVIPFTKDQTILGSRRPGDAVNLEVDILAKYVEGLAIEGAGRDS